MRNVVFCGRDEAEAICRSWSFPTVISISDPKTRQPQVGGTVQTLRLRFHDVEHDQLGFTPPDPADIIRLVNALNAGLYPVLIHCEAGLSRSAAAAMVAHYILCGDEQKALNRMRDSRASFLRDKLCPNRLMLYYADRLLGSKLLDSADRAGITRIAAMRGIIL